MFTLFLVNSSYLCCLSLVGSDVSDDMEEMTCLHFLRTGPHLLTKQCVSEVHVLLTYVQYIHTDTY